MEFVLVDLPDMVHFYPFSLTRSLTEIRVGIFSIKERWDVQLNSECQVFTSPYLQGLYEAPLVSYSTYSKAALAYHELWAELKKKL